MKKNILNDHNCLYLNTVFVCVCIIILQHVGAPHYGGGAVSNSPDRGQALPSDHFTFAGDMLAAQDPVRQAGADTDLMDDALDILRKDEADRCFQLNGATSSPLQPSYRSSPLAPVIDLTVSPIAGTSVTSLVDGNRLNVISGGGQIKPPPQYNQVVSRVPQSLQQQQHLSQHHSSIADVISAASFQANHGSIAASSSTSYTFPVSQQVVVPQQQQQQQPQQSSAEKITDDQVLLRLLQSMKNERSSPSSTT